MNAREVIELALAVLGLWLLLGFVFGCIIGNWIRKNGEDA